MAMASSLTSSLDDLRISSLDSAYDGGASSFASSMELDPNSQAIELKDTLQDLLRRCKILDEEVRTYISAVEAHQKLNRSANRVEYRNMRMTFKQELAFAKKLASSYISEEKARNHISSSNIVYLETLWNAAKRSSGLLAFRKYFFWNRQQEGVPAAYSGLSVAKGAQVKGKSSALVDIVAEDGAEWIRVSTISHKRLLFDLAKLGWQNDSDNEDDMPDAQTSNWEDDDDSDQVDIVKNARDLARAARANPIRGRPPQVRMVFTRIHPGETKEIDVVIAKIRATGAIVQCANELPPPPALSDVLPKLLVDGSRTLSSILNIDCTILLALVSDISHSNCPILDWYPKEVKLQIKEEAEEKLLPTHLYPAIGARPMVCTQEAANQMNLIVDTLATDTEKTRANILLAQNDHQATPPENLKSIWANMSDYPVPEGFQLPIRVVASNIDQAMLRLPRAAEKIGSEIGALNQAIFFYGWAEGLTTLSANRTRAAQIEHMINAHGLEDGEAGPHIWLCGESRSLIAKKGRRG